MEKVVGFEPGPEIMVAKAQRALDHWAGKPPVGIVLAGGHGTRLRTVRADLPKPMFPSAGQPFIEWVLRHLERNGLRQCLVSVGHRREVVEGFVSNRSAGRLALKCVAESEPLGTGGAIRAAWSCVPGRSVCVVNGDSLLLADWRSAREAFARPEVDGVLLGVVRTDCGRYGALEIDECNRLVTFGTTHSGGGCVNGGVYLLKPHLVEDFPEANPCSVEADVFPTMIDRGRHLVVVATEAPFLDIGVPEDYASVDAFLGSHWDEVAAP